MFKSLILLFLLGSSPLMAQGYPGGKFGSGTFPGGGFGGGMLGYAGKNERVKPRDFPQIKIQLYGEKSSINCKIDTEVEVYICDNKGKPLLVKTGGYGYSSIGTDDKGEIKNLNIQKVESGEKTLYEIPKYEGINVTFPSLPPVASGEYLEKVTSVETFFNDNDGSFPPKTSDRKKGSPAYEAIAQSILQKKEALKNQYDKAFNDTKYSVELENGQKINCERGSTRPFSPEEQEQAKNFNVSIQCGTFKCEPLRIKDKTYDATMLFESAPMAGGGAAVHFFDRSGLGPRIRVKKVFSEKISTPLVDYSPILSSKEEFNPMAMYENMFPQSLGEDRARIAEFKSPLFEQFMMYQKNVCSDKTALDNLDNARKQLIGKLAELEMKEFIQVMADGTLVGAYIDPNKAAEYGCLYDGLILDENAARNLDKLRKNIYPDRVVNQTISLKKANELFKKAAARKDIAWKYKYDGCYARAHLMARMFEAEGVRTDKVWIKGDLYVPETDIRWNFHVAPIVYVDDGKGGNKKMVIDPSLFDKPVTVEEWDQRMSKNTVKGSVVTAFPFPENAAAFERSALAFSSSDPYLPRESIHLNEESKMQMSLETMKRYKPLEPK